MSDGTKNDGCQLKCKVEVNDYRDTVAIDKKTHRTGEDQSWQQGASIKVN